jgi:hypothetical protein
MRFIFEALAFGLFLLTLLMLGVVGSAVFV